MNKLEISQAKEISKSAEANITNMAAAMNPAPIEDYSKVPTTTETTAFGFFYLVRPMMVYWS